MIEQRYLDLLRELTADESPHSGRTLLEHLTGTYDLLEKWGDPKDVCVGGLFHSIYGTQYYTVQSTDLADRKRIADIIGPQAEELAFLFCTTDRMSFFTEADKASPMLVDTTTRKSVSVSTATLRALIEIEVANRLEQFQTDTASSNVIDSMRYMLRAGDRHMTRKAREELARALEQFN